MYFQPSIVEAFVRKSRARLLQIIELECPNFSEQRLAVQEKLVRKYIKSHFGWAKHFVLLNVERPEPVTSEQFRDLGVEWELLKEYFYHLSLPMYRKQAVHVPSHLFDGTDNELLTRFSRMVDVTLTPELENRNPHDVKRAS